MGKQTNQNRVLYSDNRNYVYIFSVQIFIKTKGGIMKYNRLLAVVMIIIMITMSACQNSEDKKTTNEPAYAGHKVTVVEAINGKTYTYLRVTENGDEHWAAISKRDTKVGETLYYIDALEMKNFESKELERTFETIRFVTKISNKRKRH